MKSLFIIGHPRSGKTTLANMVADKCGFSFVSLDPLVHTFKQIFPELGLHREPHKSEPTFAPFLFRYMDEVIKESPNRQFVFEGCHISLKTTEKMIDKNNWQIVVLGCAENTPEQFMQNMRKHDGKSDWTSQKGDEELKQIAESFIGWAKQFEKESVELGMHFIDTSFDRDAKFNEFIETLGVIE